MAVWQEIFDAPGKRLASVLIFGFAVSALVVGVALRQSVWETSFVAGDVLSSERGEIALEPLDLMAEPGEIVRHEELFRFYARQDQILAVTENIPVTLKRGESTSVLTPRKAGLEDLPVLFWVQVLVGLGALGISGWIWALRSRDLACRLFVGSGLSVFVSALPSAVYTTRPLAIPSSTFRVLEEFNALGAAAFGVAMIALFLIYPVRLPHWRKLAIGQAVFFTVWTGLFIAKLTPEDANITLIIAVLMLLICVAIGAQFVATKGDPAARASLTWLGLSVLTGAGAFVVFNTVPLLLKMTPLNQGYAFLFFLIIYLGLAAGLTRYRLFEVGQWAFRFLFYAAGAVFLVLLDAALIFVVGMERLPALGLTLLAVGFLYLPFRDLLWRSFSRHGRMEPHEMLAGALHVAFAPSSAERAGRWQNLLRRVFDPLEMQAAPARIDKVQIVDDGLTLLVPSVASAPPLRLSYPWSGRSLYNPPSRELARQIVSLIEQAESNRDAYDRGVSEERRRMAQDLHDDVGARLLTGLSLADDKIRPTLQGALADIRSIVSGMTGEKIDLGRLLDELRYECARRLTAANVELEWPLTEGTESRSLDYRQSKAIGSALREIVSNVIRHSGAGRLEISVEHAGSELSISIRDDGKGIPEDVRQGDGGGFGLKSLRRRLEDVGGRFHIESGGKGVFIRLSMPYEISVGTKT